MCLKKLISLFLFIVFYFTFCGAVFALDTSVISPLDLNGNGIADKDEAEVVVSSNISLPAGEYNFNNLIVTNNAVLTLEGDPLSLNSFKGVKIIATNLTIDSGSSISADQKGYGPDSGPGVSSEGSVGASYGGFSLRGDLFSNTYGSATKPIDLGSGGAWLYHGGGAIYLAISNTFTNNGIVSSDGGGASSGGSIYVTVKNITGSGVVRANGGPLYASGYFKSPGGGGRVALYYQTSSFSGIAEAKGGCGSYDGYSQSCGQNGTVGFFDELHNNLYLNSSWKFLQADAPFSFNNIYISNGAKVISENDVQITANNLLVDKSSSFDLADNQVLNVPIITIDGNSTLTLSGSETIAANTLTLTGNSTITVLPEKILSLIIPNLNIQTGSSISADAKGYGVSQGPGAPITDNAGASYGGISIGGIATSIYGSATKPTDFGSGGNSYGGGAVRLVVTNLLANNGVISAGGNASSSGGSVYVTAKNITGSGIVRANGGSLYASGYFKSPGGGGRVALYYETLSFTGTVEAKGGCGSYDGYSPSCGQNGTVGFFDTINNNLLVNTSWQFRQNDSPFNFNHIIFTGAQVATDDGVEITANDILVDEVSTLTFSGNETINADTLLVTGNSTITVLPEKILYLKIPNITVSSGSIISADAKGYITGLGTPDTYYEAGASYGGKGGGATAKSSYGSETAPVDFGSGTESRRGGGAIRLLVDNILQNDGIISANGNSQHVSGGSIYVTANKIKGNGVFQANGGNSDWPYGSIGGGGGRIAVYFQESSFTGTATALAGVFCFYGCAPAGGVGTVIMGPSIPVCTVDCFSNVLFLPGVMGSRLYEEGLNCGPDIIGSECEDKELWVSTSDSLHEKLLLNTQGKSINNIFTKNDTQNNGELDETGIVDDVYSFNTYQSFIDDLRKWKDIDKIIADYDFIPYDWRLSLDDIITNGATSADNNLSYTNSQNFSESFILKKLAELQVSSRTGKVTIIAHSNGGLVAKALIQKLKDTNNPLYDKIDKIILVAVPQVGTPDAMAALLHGAEIGPAGLIMSNERSRQLLENMPTIYNLLPSANYFTMPQIPFAPEKLVSFQDNHLFTPQTSKYGLYITTSEDLKNYILGTDDRTKPSFSDTVHPNIGNSALYAQAESVHQILDSWQPSSNTKVIQVAGWGEETLAGLDYKTYVNFFGSEYISYKPRKVVDGDGVVVVPSALWMSDSNPNIERWWVDLEKYNRNSIILRTQHRDILEIPNMRSLINSEITDSPFNDSDNIIVNNTSTLISDGSRLHYTLHSPLTLGIESQGRYTGQDPVTKEIREEIPNVTYEQIGDVQFLSVPTGITYTLKMQGYQSGSFSLDVDKQEGNEITASTSFQGIPSSTSTVATMDITSDSEVSNINLKIDQNGDGVTVFNLASNLNGVVVMPKYIFSGFLQPINDTSHQAGQSLSVFKSGSTIPVKFQLKNLNGAITPAISAPIWLPPEIISSMNVSVDEPVYSLPATAGSAFKWDSASQQYIYNWSTKGFQSGKWYKISAKLDDGYTYFVTIGLK